MATALVELMRSSAPAHCGAHAASHWIEELHPAGTGLASALSQELLRSSQRPDEAGDGDVLDALRLLAPLSPGAREVLLPSVLAQRVRDYTCGDATPDASEQAAIMRDTRALGSLCPGHYDGLCERGFKPQSQEGHARM